VRRFAAEHCARHRSWPDAPARTSGTVTTVRGIHLRSKPTIAPGRRDCWNDRQHPVTAVLDELRAMSYDERVASPCIGTERSDLVLAGCAILKRSGAVFRCTRLRVAGSRAARGMLVEMMRTDMYGTARNAGLVTPRRMASVPRGCGEKPKEAHRSFAEALARTASSMIRTWPRQRARACVRAPPTKADRDRRQISSAQKHGGRVVDLRAGAGRAEADDARPKRRRRRGPARARSWRSTCSRWRALPVSTSCNSISSIRRVPERSARDAGSGGADLVLVDMAANGRPGAPQEDRSAQDHGAGGGRQSSSPGFRQVTASGGSFLTRCCKRHRSAAAGRLKRDFATLKHVKPAGQPRGFGRAVSAGDGIRGGK